ncbi:rRNA maturation RNase YbeY [Parvicella tangerina]|uniref:Endoribonuclease YbeY n=1 Tax=Parvicella tangerina TaxID=2829795 RepID=A0A916JJG5_9FLAO|nr:rRNA maturation RNase YbeY [Parvicella tangerina]CAG5076265.1 Endoribonuclease YbeY [Parvicella tangerina]
MIYYHQEDIAFDVKNKLSLRKWINEAIKAEGKTPSAITYIFCSDQYLLELNRSALNHDYYTDIITFDYCEENIVSGDLFISIERVEDNANKLGVTFLDELHRVMIHGVLHLCGYKDKSKKDEELMREKEDYYLNLRSF